MRRGCAAQPRLWFENSRLHPLPCSGETLSSYHRHRPAIMMKDEKAHPHIETSCAAGAPLRMTMANRGQKILVANCKTELDI
jgi:hypothetical protein